ncbi:MAG TPA: hypothetical protein VG273_21395 [Bryobacteraceae bacterium]|jgi:antitoxin MazE|nr:hypothetical protein [Bryobacteraceae bacterium]
MDMDDGALVLRGADSSIRKGWAEAAKEIAEANDDALVMGELGNAADGDLTW